MFIVVVVVVVVEGIPVVVEVVEAEGEVVGVVVAAMILLCTMRPHKQVMVAVEVGVGTKVIRMVEMVVEEAIGAAHQNLVDVVEATLETKRTDAQTFRVQQWEKATDFHCPEMQIYQ